MSGTSTASPAQVLLGRAIKFLIMNKTATTIPFDPDSTTFPLRKDVPQPSYAPSGIQTAWVWGEKDELGRLNLLTPARVKAASRTEIQTGEMVSLKYAVDCHGSHGFPLLIPGP